jgi:hypothetical protein
MLIGKISMLFSVTCWGINQIHAAAVLLGRLASSIADIFPGRVGTSLSSQRSQQIF